MLPLQGGDPVVEPRLVETVECWCRAVFTSDGFDRLITAFASIADRPTGTW